jgi:hypothetical protein
VHGHHGVKTRQVHTVLTAAGDVPGQQDVTVVLGGGPQPDAVAADIAVADLEIVPFNSKAHFNLPLAQIPARQRTVLPFAL